MQFPLTEPTSPRYIYINPETNNVHVLMPIVSGTHIGLDNTCKSVYALQEFFGKSRDVHQRAVLDELTAYQKALEFDISLINDEDEELTTKKQERLSQINHYIVAIEAILHSQVLETLNLVFPEYPEALKKMMEQDESNVYSIVLRPEEMDNFLRFVNPIFSVKRDGMSVFHETLMRTYQRVTKLPGAKERFYDSVQASFKEQSVDFEKIKSALSEYIKNTLKIEVNFDQNSIRNPITADYDPITKEYIEGILGCNEEEPATARDYIEVLLNTCSPQLLEELIESPFYTRHNGAELSIITQFFLAVINFHCRTNGISVKNFGAILDSDEELSKKIAARVLSITNGESIEDALLTLVNDNSESFGFARPLTLVDGAAIKERFQRNYSEINKAPHFDEFILLDESKKGTFISHQSSICCNLAEFVHAALPELTPDHFKLVCADLRG
ncbi:MAG: hypothetical protein Q8M03_04165 [Legionella sp.]|nr:hypothetical protein [Legionella sp.]